MLAADPGVEEATWSRFAAELAAHLEADEMVFHPAVERALTRPLVPQRELYDRMRRVLVRIAGAGRGRAHRSEWLRELRGAFQEHARFEEGVALPALESVLGEQALDDLWGKLRAARDRSAS